MKKITKFEASDGTEFLTKKECKERENIIKDVKKIMEPLGKLPKDPQCDFTNGGGYIPHKVSVVISVKKELLAYGIKMHQLPSNITFSEAGRYFDDNNSTLYPAWLRLTCCDAWGQEWGQLYYARNPYKGKQKIYVE